jgi:hypothetical protein
MDSDRPDSGVRPRGTMPLGVGPFPSPTAPRDMPCENRETEPMRLRGAWPAPTFDAPAPGRRAARRAGVVAGVLAALAIVALAVIPRARPDSRAELPAVPETGLSEAPMASAPSAYAAPSAAELRPSASSAPRASSAPPASSAAPASSASRSPSHVRRPRAAGPSTAHPPRAAGTSLDVVDPWSHR